MLLLPLVVGVGVELAWTVGSREMVPLGSVPLIDVRGMAVREAEAAEEACVEDATEEVLFALADTVSLVASD